MTTVFHDITKMIKDHNHVVIMGHRNIDLDAFGSSLCLYKIIHSMGISCGIYLNFQELDPSIENACRKLKEREVEIEYITLENYKRLVTDQTLLIILDTHKTSMVENSQMVDEMKDIIIIDHHIKSTESIEKEKYIYINSNLSSTTEFMVNYLKYLNKTISPMIATIMLAGIEIDTNGFNVKTTDKTYEAAAFLTKLGADHIQKQELLKQNKENYLKRQDYVKNSFMINHNMAMCILDDGIHTKADLAMTAEEILKFEDVEVSFAIGKLSDQVTGVSARSVGNIDVEKIMTQIGVGGHKTDAAAQLENFTMPEIREKIEQIVK